MNRTAFSVLSLSACLCLPAQAEIQVAASIPPIHSLVSAVMEGVSEPALVMDATASPHNFALKPSQAKLMENLDLFFWIGPALETGLDKSVDTLLRPQVVSTLSEIEGLIVHAPRENAIFKADDEHHDHADDHDEAHSDDDEHGPADPHIWLDPENAKRMVDEIVKRLAAADPESATIFKTNAEATKMRLDDLIEEQKAQLAAVPAVPFVVFHDAYQYFEKRFGLEATGAVVLSPEAPPSAKRVRALQNAMQKVSTGCVFSEPQFNPSIVTTITEGADITGAMLDPMGVNLQPGPDHYFALLRNLGQSFADCFSARIEEN